MLPHKLLSLTSDGDADDNSSSNNGNNMSKKKINTNISYHNYNEELNEEFEDNHEKVN